MHRSVATAGYHTAGAPFRVVVSGAPQLEGIDMLGRSEYAARYADDVRRLVVSEPRGHDAMHGCFVTPAEDADLGAVFFNNAGFIPACGHGTIALVTWAIESGFVPTTDGRVSIATPVGTVVANARVEGGEVLEVAYVGTPSYVAALFVPVQLASGVVPVDIAYGGAYFAAVDVGELELTVSMQNLRRFTALGREIAVILRDNPAVEHPTDHRLSGFGGTIFYEELAEPGPGKRQRSITVFAGGTADRSPCGTGTSARLAVLDSLAALARGEYLVNEGVLGTEFRGRVVGDADVGGLHGVATEIRGRAFRTGTTTLVQDEDDPLGPGFRLG